MQPFFDVIVHEVNGHQGLSGLCLGFEKGQWRSNRFSEYVFEYLPEFCLTSSELEKIDYRNAASMLKRAAQLVFKTKKFENRGEFGELILHAVLREVFHTIPAISKIYYKSAKNKTVEGFDAVHVIVSKKSLELWLGEVKFYKDIDKAIADVVKEINGHADIDYLRDEFALICNKIDSSWKYADRLGYLLDPNVSLDTVFDNTCIPVLLTYESKTTKDYDAIKSQYKKKIEDELRTHYTKFFKSGLPNIKIHLFLIPLKSKAEILQKLQDRLEAWKQI